MNDTTLSLRMSAAESQALRQRAEQEGVSQGSLVRQALRACGITPAAEPEASGYDVIKHLVGKARGGSRDLSTNKEHLAGYGR